MTEADIIKALHAWHDGRGELFFPHVKTGASWTYKGQQLRILDGLAVKISWTNPIFQGYEIKISRSDFLRDKKYTDYLPYCTGFAFVCPDKMIKKDELPDHVGLVYYKDDGSLRTVRKAANSEPDPMALNSLLRYLVYYRSGSSRRQIAAAARQVVRERRTAAEMERAADHYKQSYREVQDDYYKLRREARKAGLHFEN